MLFSFFTTTGNLELLFREIVAVTPGLQQPPHWWHATVRAVPVMSKREVAIHAKDTVPWRKSIFFQLSIKNGTVAHFSSMGQPASVDMVQTQELYVVFTATRTHQSSSAVRRQDFEPQLPILSCTISWQTRGQPFAVSLTQPLLATITAVVTDAVCGITVLVEKFQLALATTTAADLCLPV
jgi:hypothetical protein